MRIDSIQVSNKFYEWECDKIDFHSNLTLLVGTSGVGKTQILEGIGDIQSIANGKSINGLEWVVDFSSFSGRRFHWEGAFEVLEDTRNPLDILINTGGMNDDVKFLPQIRSELLTCNGDTIISRNEADLLFKGARMPKLSSKQSAIFILKEEEIVQDAFDSLKKIFIKDHSGRKIEFGISSKSLDQLLAQYASINEIRNSDENIKVKVLLSSELGLPVFEEIKARFISIFPQVEDLKIEPVNPDRSFEVPKWTRPVFLIKEHSVHKWISEDRMSSGMLRTINHICQLYLSNEGSVILLDELENSLGTNCIDILTEDLIHENSGIQFIATSHHPYIINNIPYEYWKIVTRKGGHIVVKDATDYNLGDSKQDAFIRLTRVLEAQYK